MSFQAHSVTFYIDDYVKSNRMFLSMQQFSLVRAHAFVHDNYCLIWIKYLILSVVCDEGYCKWCSKSKLNETVNNENK